MGEVKNVVGTITKIFTGYGFVRVYGEKRDIYLNFGELAKLPDIRSWHGGLQPRQGDKLVCDYTTRGSKTFVTRVRSYNRSPYTLHQGKLGALRIYFDVLTWHSVVRYSIEEDGYPPTNVSHAHINRLGIKPEPTVWDLSQEQVEVRYRRTHAGRIDQSSIRLA
jgi:hypothetical protein